MNLPLYYSTTLTSTFATVSTHIPSYEAIHGRMPLHYYHSYNFRYVSHMGFHELPLSDASQHANLRKRYHTDLRALIAAAKCLDMSIELRLTVTDEFVAIPDANHPETRRNPTNEKSYRLEIYESQMQRGMNCPPN